MITSNWILASDEGTMLRVVVYDDTVKKPISEKAEIWFKGHGSWWLKRELKFGGTDKLLGRRPIGEKDHVFLYVDGRKKKEIKIPIQMTSEMNPNGSHRDSLIINIGDKEVEVIGFPLEAAMGKTSTKFKRK